jgi:hypothetical protein
MNSHDVAIAYRIYPKVALPGKGLPYSDDKLRLSEICLRSLKESLGPLRAKLWVLLDGCDDSYAQMFRKYFDDRDLVLMPLPAIGNLPTFGKQIEILSQQTDSEFVYFAEDDYVYLPNQFSLMLGFMKSGKDVDFISPYDHLDCYTKEIHDRPKWLRVFNGHHWRTAASTCLTFLTTREKLQTTTHMFQTYCRRNSDCSLWLSLTKLAIYNPVSFARFAFQEPLFAKIIIKAWLHGPFQNVFGRRWHLWVPVPAVATHLDAAALSPSFDWAKQMKQLANRCGFDTAGAVDVESLDASVAAGK